MKVCTAEQMRRIDKSASENGHIPSVVLMENAAIACVEEILSDKTVKAVCIFCGKGNNGGDGFCAARHLKNAGVEVAVYLVCGREFSKDALINYEIISAMDIPIYDLFEKDLSPGTLAGFDVIVDAIFGTGMRGAPEGAAKDAIKLINSSAKKVLSIDIPSGVSADDGKVAGEAVRADVTVTFAAYKFGLLLYPGAEYCGKIVCAPISIPEYIIEKENINTNIIDKKLVEGVFPKRKDNSQKGDYGKVLIVGGATGLSGACAMAAKAAARSGAGLVTVAVPDGINDILEAKLTEPMTVPLPSSGGMISEEAADILKRIINGYDVCLFGPGAGRGESVGYVLSELLKVSKIPVIIDADGLYALSKNIDMISECGCSLILTPHEMEMARLIGRNIDHVVENRIAVGVDLAARIGASVVLKGHHTVVTSHDGSQYININGNSGMATGGSGDCLSGIIAAFSAMGMKEAEAAFSAVYIHGLSGDTAASKVGKNSLIASDIIDNLPFAIKETAGE